MYPADIISLLYLRVIKQLWNVIDINSVNTNSRLEAVRVIIKSPDGILVENYYVPYSTMASYENKL